MANKEFERMIKIGEWLEAYLNPEIKVWEYKNLTQKADSLYNISFQLNNDLSLQVIDFIFELRPSVQALVLDREQRNSLVEKFSVYLSAHVKTWEELALAFEGISYEWHYRNIVGKIKASGLLSDETTALVALVDILFMVKRNCCHEHVSRPEITNLRCFSILDIIDYRWAAIKIFKKINSRSKLWSQTFSDELDEEKKENLQTLSTPFREIHESSQSIIDVIQIKNGVAMKTTTFNAVTLDYAECKGGATLFPWGPLVAKTLIDFLFLGGQEYFLFCEQCGRFTVIRRKGRKKFCSDICRTNFGNEQRLKQNFKK